MRITRKKSPQYLRLTIAVLVVVALISGALWFMSQQNKSKSPTVKQPNTVNYDAPTSDQIQATTDTKAPSSDTSNSSTTASQAASVSVNISSTSISDGILHIRTVVNSVTSGTCTLTLSRTGASAISKDADLQALSTYSTCQGFDVPVGILTPGKWTASVSVKTSGSATGNASREVIIE